jgi:hypothetical protein
MKQNEGDIEASLLNSSDEKSLLELIDFLILRHAQEIIISLKMELFSDKNMYLIIILLV